MHARTRAQLFLFTGNLAGVQQCPTSETALLLTSYPFPSQWIHYIKWTFLPDITAAPEITVAPFDQIEMVHLQLLRQTDYTSSLQSTMELVQEDEIPRNATTISIYVSIP